VQRWQAKFRDLRSSTELTGLLTWLEQWDVDYERENSLDHRQPPDSSLGSRGVGASIGIPRSCSSQPERPVVHSFASGLDDPRLSENSLGSKQKGRPKAAFVRMR
jgi:hypothetical protein